MQTILTEKLRTYLVENNPDVLISLQNSASVSTYLEDKVALVMPLAEQLLAESKPLHIIEEICLNELTGELRPSKFLYIKAILEEDFLQTYNRFREIGVLTYEIINLIEACKSVFEAIGFTEENQDERALKYAVMGTIQEYLEA